MWHRMTAQTNCTVSTWCTLLAGSSCISSSIIMFLGYRICQILDWDWQNLHVYQYVKGNIISQTTRNLKAPPQQTIGYRIAHIQMLKAVQLQRALAPAPDARYTHAGHKPHFNLYPPQLLSYLVQFMSLETITKQPSKNCHFAKIRHIGPYEQGDFHV